MRNLKRVFIMVSILLLVGCQKNMEPADFEHLVLPTTPNYYYVGPDATPQPNLIAKVYSMPRDELSRLVVNTIKQEPRITVLKEEIKDGYYSFIQRTFFFRFPDQIDIQFVEVDAQHSTFYALSRSHYGHSDFGKNKKRLNEWLKKWDTMLLKEGESD